MSRSYTSVDEAIRVMFPETLAMTEEEAAREAAERILAPFRGGHAQAPPAPTLGAVVRAQRQAAGLTLRELAERCGMTATELGGIERGVSSPPAAVLATVFSQINNAHREVPRG